MPERDADALAQMARAEVAEAQVAALTRQIELADEDEDIASRHNLARAEAAEAEVGRLTEAVGTALGYLTDSPAMAGKTDAVRIAGAVPHLRAVLAGRKDAPA